MCIRFVGQWGVAVLPTPLSRFVCSACSAVWILSCIESAGRWHVLTPSCLMQAACHQAEHVSSHMDLNHQ